MTKLGYGSEQFMSLDESFESNSGSREILLAIGWLIYTYQLIDLFVTNAQGFCEEEYFKQNSIKVS
jgi:hypothetical protein